MAKALEGVRREYDTLEGAREAQSAFYNTVVTEGLLDLLTPPDGIERLTPAGRDAVERLLATRSVERVRDRTRELAPSA